MRRARVRDPHQAEGQRKARRQQKQQTAEGHAVQRLDDPELHRTIARMQESYRADRNPDLRREIEDRQNRRAAASRPREGAGSRQWSYRRFYFSRFCARIVARVDQVLQELILVVGPELAHVRIGLDHRVDVFVADLLDAADIDVPTTLPNSSKCIGPRRVAVSPRGSLLEGFLVFDLAVNRLEAGFRTSSNR